MSTKANHRPGGFTIIELTVTIVLVGVLGATAYSRWFGMDAYDASASAAEFTSMARHAQRAALARQDLNVELRVDQVGDTWRFLVLDNDGGTLTTLHQTNVDSGDTAIAVTAGIGPITLSSSVQLTVAYDGLGNPATVDLGGSAGDPADGIGVTVSAGASRNMCISPLGFAHSGACA